MKTPGANMPGEGLGGDSTNETPPNRSGVTQEPPAPTAPVRPKSLEAEPEKTRLGKIVDFYRKSSQRYTDYITKKQQRLTESDKLFAKRMEAQAEHARARTELTLASATERAVGKTAKKIANEKAQQELSKEIQAAEEAKKAATEAQIARKKTEAHNKVAKKVAKIEANIDLAKKRESLVEARKRVLEASATLRNKRVSQGGKSWLSKLDLLSGSYRKYIIAAGVAAVAITLLLSIGDVSTLTGFEGIDTPPLDVPDLGDTTGSVTPDTGGVEGMDGKTSISDPKLGTGLEQVTPTPTETLIPNAVVEHTIGTGEGITHSILELKETWPAGTDMPGWLENIDTPSEAAEWAQKNGFYNPDVAQDSLLMHKGEVLGIDTQGNLQIRYLNGDTKALTDSFGNVTSGVREGLVFTDTVAGGGLSVPTEISADTLTHAYANAEYFGNASVSYFAEPNPYLPGTSGHRAWEDIVNFLNTGGDTSWQNESMSLKEYLIQNKGVR